MQDNAPHRQPAQQLLTVREVAALDGCSERTVRRAIAAGVLAITRVGPTGRGVRIHPADHAAYRQTTRR